MEQIKPEKLLEAKMTKLKLFYFSYIMAGFFGKDNNAGENRRQREKK